MKILKAINVEKVNNSVQGCFLVSNIHTNVRAQWKLLARFSCMLCEQIHEGKKVVLFLGDVAILGLLHAHV